MGPGGQVAKGGKMGRSSGGVRKAILGKLPLLTNFDEDARVAHLWWRRLRARVLHHRLLPVSCMHGSRAGGALSKRG